MKTRIQKVISDAGYCSRRQAEAFMIAGKVKVNGTVITELGSKVGPKDVIEVQGKRIYTGPREHITIVLYKPAGLLTSKYDPHHKQTVMTILPKEWRKLKPIGRLDKDSEGLLLLSSDGNLVQELTHPKFEHKKTYEILVKGKPSEKTLQALTDGKLRLDDYVLNPMPYKLLNYTQDGKTWIELELSEGRKRQIRRVMDSLGHPVLYLKRTAIGNLRIKDLAKGTARLLTPEEIQAARSSS